MAEPTITGLPRLCDGERSRRDGAAGSSPQRQRAAGRPACPPAADDRPSCLHIVTALDFGGVETRMRTLASGASASAYSHRFLALSCGGSVERDIARLGVPVGVLGRHVGPFEFASFRAVHGAIVAERPAVVHCHGAEANLFGLPAAALARVPVRIGEEIGIPDHSARARVAFRQVYKCAHAVVGISRAVSRWLIASAELPPCKVATISNPVAPAAMPAPAASARPDRLRIGFAGRLAEVKNPLGLVRAVAILRAGGLACDLDIVGDGPLWTETGRLVEALALGGAVTLHGFLPKPIEVLSSCHLYVQPSLSEGFGIAVVEAMAAGLAPIVTAVGGAAEIVAHGRTGWLLDSPEPEAIAVAIAGAWALGPAALAAVGRAAREDVISRFDPHAYVAELDRLYRSVCDARGAAGRR